MNKYFIALFIFTINAHAKLDALFEKRLSEGESAAINSIAYLNSENDLFNLLRLSALNQFGDNSKTVKAAVIKKIGSDDSYVKNLGQRIESLSESPGQHRRRRDAFQLLATIGTPAAAEQIGSFLFDERNPDKVDPSSGVFLLPNCYLAVNAMLVIVGDITGNNKMPGFNGPEELKIWQQWWKSDASKMYRPSSKDINKNTKQSFTEPKQERDIVKEGDLQMSKTTYLVVFLGVILLIVFLSRK